MNRQKRLLVVGGNGFVGKNIQRISDGRFETLVLDRVGQDDVEMLSRSRFVQSDISDVGELRDLVNEFCPNYIVNLVSIVNAEDGIENIEKHYRVGFGVFTRLFEATRDLDNLDLFVQIGSAEEYGDIPSPMNELDREYPISPYALVKQLTTNTALMLHKSVGFPVCVIRPGNLFGPFQDTKKFVPYIIDRLSGNFDLHVSECTQERDFIFVDDFVHSLLQLLSHHQDCIGQVINISSGTSYSLRQFVLECAEILGSSSRVLWGSKKGQRQEIQQLCLDIGRLKTILGSDLYIEDPLRRLRTFLIGE